MNRLLLKSIIYRIYSGLVMFGLAFLITRDLSLSLTFGIADTLVKIFSYWYFEEKWDNLMNTYQPCVVWLTGLSGSGKTTIAYELKRVLTKKGAKCIILDGDEIRNAMPQTGFDRESRIRHNMSVGYMASLFEKQGYIVIVSLISPIESARNNCRALCEKFIEVYLDTPISVCAERDPKGLYKKAYSGEIKNFTGIDSEYEKPKNAEVNLDTSTTSLKKCVKEILFFVHK